MIQLIMKLLVLLVSLALGSTTNYFSPAFTNTNVSGCHGPSWLTDPCVPLPFGSNYSSITPSNFSHADQYLLVLDEQQVFFEITLSLQKSSLVTGCSLHVSLIPPPNSSSPEGPVPSWSGLTEIFELGGNSSDMNLTARS